MSATPSTMLSLGTKAPDFALAEVPLSEAQKNGAKIWRLEDFAGKKALLVMFISNHCPYVKHIRAGLAAMTSDFIDAGVGVVAIMANDVMRYKDDHPELMAAEKKAAGYRFPYLFDESQEVAKSYKAACTPDFFLFDGAFKLAYRGQMDESRPGNAKAVTGKDLRLAVECILQAKPVSPSQIPSIGCNIKWRPGFEPDYYGRH